MPTTTVPVSDVELFTDEALTDPFPAYKEIRDAGPSRYDVFAIGRYAPLRAALSDWETFSSAGGIGLNPVANEATKGLIIATDPPEHARLRNVLAERLAPGRRLNQLVRGLSSLPTTVTAA